MFLSLFVFFFQENTEIRSPVQSQKSVPQHFDPLGAGMANRIQPAAKKKTRLEFPSGTPAQQVLKCCYKSCGKTARQTFEKTLYKVQNHSGKTRYCKAHADQNPCSTFVIAEDK